MHSLRPPPSDPSGKGMRLDMGAVPSRKKKGRALARGSCAVLLYFMQHPYVPAHTRSRRCSAGIQAEQWPQSSQQMIKAVVCPSAFRLLYCYQTVVSPPCSHVRSGSQVKAVSPGWFGSCFPLFCLTEQTGPGRQAGRGRAGRIEGPED